VRPLLIRYVSHGYPTGYGEVGRRLIGALRSIGVDIHWVPIQFDERRPLLPDAFVSGLGELEPLRATRGRPDVVVVHSVPEVLPHMAELCPPGVPVVAHTVWEAPELQAHWPALLNGCDAVVVPTRWNADAFEAAGISAPIGVVPHALDPSTLDNASGDAAWLGPGGLDVGSSFVVHSIASWTQRKAPWLTVEAYARAFGPHDDTVLILRTDTHIEPTMATPPGPRGRRHLTSWSVAKILHDHGPTGRVHLEHNLRTSAELAALARRSNCWLSLPHAEGWNLGAFDAAVAGTPVVTTGYGGPSDYLDAHTSSLIKGTQMPAPGLEGITWLRPDLDAAVDALRAVHRDPVGQRERAGAQSKRLARRFAPKVVAQRFVAVLAELGCLPS